MKRLRIGVLYGGRSGEHEVSLASAAAVFANLDRTGTSRSPIRIEKDGRWALADRPPTAASAAEVIEQSRLDAARQVRTAARCTSSRGPATKPSFRSSARGSRSAEPTDALVTGLHVDVIFPVLHGPYGEDGTIQGLLELANVPYVGAGVAASAVGMDKALMKVVFSAHGLPSAAYRRVSCATSGSVAARRSSATSSGARVSDVRQAGQPRIERRHLEGEGRGRASRGDRSRRLVRSQNRRRGGGAGGARDRVRRARQRRPEASVPGEVIPSREFYDYEAKYLDEGSQIDHPGRSAGIDGADEMRRLVDRGIPRRSTAPAWRASTSCSRAHRRDLYVNEINTIPGFTTISMYSKMWAASGVTYPALLDRLIELALERHADKQQLRTSLT